MKFRAVVYLSYLGTGMSYLKGVFFLIFSFLLGVHPLEAASVKEAFKESQREALEKDLPLLVAFLGSGWCPWSIKMENELFSDETLLQKLQGKCLLLQIDMPAKASSDPSFIEIQEIMEEYQVRESPTFVLLSNKGKWIAREGFLPLSGEQLTNRWIQCFESFAEITKSLENPSLSELNLGSLYEKAKTFGMCKLQEEIVDRALTIAKEPFFYLEKFKALSNERKASDPGMLSLRKKIKTLDPNNEHKAHLELAMIDFASFQKRKKNRTRPGLAAQPLLDYIEQFGKKDPENLWKVEMKLSEYFFSRGLLDLALVHAEMSLKEAPESMKEDMKQAIDYFKTAIQHSAME
jgi:protein disulfide-isomerase